MKAVFADSIYFFALLNARDAIHQRAVRFATQSERRSDELFFSGKNYSAVRLIHFRARGKYRRAIRLGAE
jgi:hypothetical protein